MRSLTFTLASTPLVGCLFGVVFGVWAISLSDLNGRLGDICAVTGWTGLTFSILFIPVGIVAVALVAALQRKERLSLLLRSAYPKGLPRNPGLIRRSGNLRDHRTQLGRRLHRQARTGRSTALSQNPLVSAHRVVRLTARYQ